MYFAYVFIERFKSVDAYWVHQFLLHFAFFYVERFKTNRDKSPDGRTNVLYAEDTSVHI